MAPTPEQLVEALRPVEDPELHRSIVDLGMLRRAEMSGDGVAHILVALTVAGCPLRNEIQNRVSTAVTALDGVSSVDLEFTVMTDDERAALREMLHGSPGATAGSGHAHGHAEGRAIPFSQPGSKTRPLLISSGKGGVGKSSVTVNLAAGLAARGLTVGVLDADIWGFSVPRLLGMSERMEASEVDGRPRIIPNRRTVGEGTLEVVSTGFLVEESTALMWRGLMLTKAVEQFLNDVAWGDLDYLLIDMPPGTGDVQMGLARMLPRTEMLIVTTPARAAQKVAQRAADMARRSFLPVIGVVENMSAFIPPDQPEKRYALFGSGGGKTLAEAFDVPLLAEIPMEMPVQAGGDQGLPITRAKPDSISAQQFITLAERLSPAVQSSR